MPKKQLSVTDSIGIKIRDLLTSIAENEIYEKLVDLYDEAYDAGYEDGIDFGMRAAKVQAKGIDPVSSEGEKEIEKLKSKGE